MRVDWSQNLVDPPTHADRSAGAVLRRPDSSAPGSPSARGTRRSSTRTGRSSRATTSTSRIKQIRTPDYDACIEDVRPLSTTAGPGAAARRRSPTATPCCPFRGSEYEPLSYPDRQTAARQRREADPLASIRLRSRPERQYIPCTPDLAGGGGAVRATTAPRRRSISSRSSATSAPSARPTTARWAPPSRGATTSSTAGTSGRTRIQQDAAGNPILDTDGNPVPDASTARPDRRARSPTT